MVIEKVKILEIIPELKMVSGKKMIAFDEALNQSLLIEYACTKRASQAGNQQGQMRSTVITFGQV